MSATTKTIKEKDHYIEAVGRRKTSIARVRLLPNTKGVFMINDKPMKTYFATEELRLVATVPFTKTEMDGKYSVTAKITGGGIHSQAEALSHGIARALLKADEASKPVLRQNKLLTRDSRMKERRKFGLKKARKSPQWSKR
jgi:small subunit ribosomal protein S9